MLHLLAEQGIQLLVQFFRFRHRELDGFVILQFDFDTDNFLHIDKTGDGRGTVVLGKHLVYPPPAISSSVVGERLTLAYQSETIGFRQLSA